MSQETTEIEATEPILAKLYSHINEEKLIKDQSSMPLNRFKSMDELAMEITLSKKREDLIQVLQDNLTESPKSLVSRYFIGTLTLGQEDADGIVHLRDLLEDFRRNAKWTIVDHIADRILDKDPNNRIALRAKVESTERLKGKKELKPYLERLASIDRKNPDIAKKYALSILTEDKKRALSFLKQAGETYARIKDYKNLEDVWNLIVANNHEDLAFFERIERVLVGNREKTRAAAYLVSLLEPYRIEENWGAVINILKKILQYETSSSRARSDLVRAFRNKYKGHSLLDDFLKMSELTNNKKPVGACIASFERNIVFDVNNFVYHRTRGVGKITEIDKSQMTIDFRNNPGQRMTIQMAITSLKPLGPEHIWVKYYENPDELNEIFKEEIPLFFEMLLSSFDYKMSLSEIKTEVCERFIPVAEWSKWWSRARTQLKKDPKFGFNPRKKDELHLRETPMTLSEELSMKFQHVTDWNKKLELAQETLKDPDTEGAVELCVHYYNEQEDSKEVIKLIHSYLFLEAAANAIGEEDVPRKLVRKDILDIIHRESAETLVNFCAETTIVEFKRDIINLIIQAREDYPEILGKILFELPIKVNRYVITELNRLGQFKTLEKFINRAFSKFREHPEIFLWTARFIVTDQWNYEWIHFTKVEVMLLVFRLLKPLARIEPKGTRLKNMAIDTLFGTTNITSESVRKGVLPDILKDAELSTIRRMSALFREVPYIPEAHKENFMDLILEINPDFTPDTGIEEEEDIDEIFEGIEEKPLFPDDNVILVSQVGMEKRRLYLDRLINVDMPANSRDIGEAQAKGDLRENAEYKAALERQSQLQAEITRVDAEIKQALLLNPDDIRTDVVSIGTRALLKTDDDTIEYTILGPWEADSENNVISYLSPLGKTLIGTRVGEQAVLEGKSFEVQKIVRAID